MRKRKIIAVSAGIMALIMASALTYAWFTSQTEPTNLTVNAAKIELVKAAVEPEALTDRLPGETVYYESTEGEDEGEGIEFSIENTSTRECVVKLDFSDIDIVAGEDREELDADRKADILLPALRESLRFGDDDTDPLAGLLGGDLSALDGTSPDVSRIFQVTGEDNIYYLWLNVGEQPFSDGAGGDTSSFSFSLTVPKELGGNIEKLTATPPTEGTDPGSYNDYQNEHEAVITLSFSAMAVQGTVDALEENFGIDVSEHYAPLCAF